MNNKEFKVGLILGYFSILVNNLSSVFYTPVMLKCIGQNEYGIYSLCYSIVGYLTLLDFGIGNAVIRYIAKFKDEENEEYKKELNGMFFLIYLLLGIIVMILGLLLLLNLNIFFSDAFSISDIRTAKTITLILLINAVLTFPLSIFTSIITAYEKFIFVRMINVLRSLLLPIIMIPLLLRGHGVITMSLVISLLNIIVLLASTVYCFYFLEVKFSFKKFNFQILKEILNYSFFVFLLLIVDKVNWSIDQIIIGKISSTKDIAIYSVSSQIIQIFFSFSGIISSMMLPRLTILCQKNHNNEELNNIFLKISKVQLCISTFILFGFILVGRQFLSLWAGYQYEFAYIITIILMSVTTIPLSLNIANTIILAKNLQKFRATVLIIIALVNVLISIPFAKKYGIIGCTFGTTVSYIIGHIIIMPIYFSKKLKLDMKKFYICVLQIILVSSLSLIITNFINRYLNFNYLLNEIILLSLIFSVFFFVFMYVFGTDPSEKFAIKKIYYKLYKNLKMKRSI